MFMLSYKTWLYMISQLTKDYLYRICTSFYSWWPRPSQACSFLAQTKRVYNSRNKYCGSLLYRKKIKKFIQSDILTIFSFITNMNCYIRPKIGKSFLNGNFYASWQYIKNNSRTCLRKSDNDVMISRVYLSALRLHV